MQEGKRSLPATGIIGGPRGKGALRFSMLRKLTITELAPHVRPCNKAALCRSWGKGLQSARSGCLFRHAVQAHQHRAGSPCESS